MDTRWRNRKRNPAEPYFIDHPEMVCGEMQMVSGPYGMRSTCVPNEQSPLAEQLDAALSTLHAEYTLVDEQEYAEEEEAAPLMRTPMCAISVIR